MKNYIGVKVIKAEPQERDGEQGYKVVYPDGYVSWCPKGSFEDSYREFYDDWLNFANSNIESGR